MVVEAEDGQRLATGSELPVGYVISWVHQFDQSSLSACRQDAAVLGRGPAPSGHQHRGPGQREELLQTQTQTTSDKHLKLILWCEKSIFHTLFKLNTDRI